MGNVVNCMHLENDQVLLRTRDYVWVADGTKDEGATGWDRDRLRSSWPRSVPA